MSTCTCVEAEMHSTYIICPVYFLYVSGACVTEALNKYCSHADYTDCSIRCHKKLSLAKKIESSHMPQENVKNVK